MKPLLKLAIAVLLLLCLVDMPYGFYQLVRFAATAAFAYLAYDILNLKRMAKASCLLHWQFFFSHSSKLHLVGLCGTLLM